MRKPGRSCGALRLREKAGLHSPQTCRSLRFFLTNERQTLNDYQLANLVVRAANINGMSLREYIASLDALADITETERARRCDLYVKFVAENLRVGRDD